jgi:hypothetical protein
MNDRIAIEGRDGAFAAYIAKSLFGLIDAAGAGTQLAVEFDGTRVLVCDDLRDESADFILLQDATAHHRKRVVFIHAKARHKASHCSASALQDVCGQAQKNLREASLFAEAGPSKRVKWSRPWDGTQFRLPTCCSRPSRIQLQPEVAYA